MNWIESKYFWVNVITIILVAISYAISNNTFPSWAGYLVFADAILNAILGVLDKQEAVKLKKALIKMSGNKNVSY